MESSKTTLERVEELIEGVWKNCLDAMEEWGIGEFEEMLEAFTSKAKAVEQLRASSEVEITDLSVLNTESMEIFVVDPTKLMTQIQE